MVCVHRDWHSPGPRNVSPRRRGGCTQNSEGVITVQELRELTQPQPLLGLPLNWATALTAAWSEALRKSCSTQAPDLFVPRGVFNRGLKEEWVPRMPCFPARGPKKTKVPEEQDSKGGTRFASKRNSASLTRARVVSAVLKLTARRVGLCGKTAAAMQTSRGRVGTAGGGDVCPRPGHRAQGVREAAALGFRFGQQRTWGLIF